MKRFLLALVLVAPFYSCDQLQPLAKAYGDAVINSNTKPTESEVIYGLKEALSVGLKKAVQSTSKTDGFYKNNLIKIPLPQELEKVNSTLRNLGMGSMMDDFELSLNRAAEEASAKATDIFISAITKMTFQDAIAIWQGENDAATQFLKRTTTSELTKEFKPIAANAIDQVNVTKYWKDIADVYNKIPLVTKVNPDLDQYVTDQAIDGLFIMVAQEEGKIRENPAARVSDILVKVFGYLDNN